MKKLLFLSILSLSMGLTSCIQDDDTPIIIEVGNGNSGGSTTDPQDVVINKTGWEDYYFFLVFFYDYFLFINLVN